MRLLTGCVALLLSSVLSADTLVVVKPLSELIINTTHSAPAQVINEQHVSLSARISATVENIHVQVGDNVESGQLLVSLECRDYKLAHQQAVSALRSVQAQIRLASQQLARAEKLLKQKNASIELRDQRKAELDSLVAQRLGANASVETAQLAVDRCEVKAPFAGVVTAKIISTGSLVNPGAALLNLLSLSGQEVSADLSVEQVASLPDAQKVYFQHNEQAYPLSIRSVIPLLDNRARTQQVRLSFADKKALSGSSGRLNWLDDTGRLPSRFIVSRNGQLGLMSVMDGKARFVVLPDAIEGQAVTVDMPMDSQIIIEGQHAVEQDEPVTIAEKG